MCSIDCLPEGVKFIEWEKAPGLVQVSVGIRVVAKIGLRIFVVDACFPMRSEMQSLVSWTECLNSHFAAWEGASRALEPAAAVA